MSIYFRNQIGKWFGWIALALIVVITISGFGWDIRTSNLVSTLTGGFMNRITSTNLHTYLLIPLILAIVLHVALALGRHSTQNTLSAPKNLKLKDTCTRPRWPTVSNLHLQEDARAKGHSSGFLLENFKSAHDQH